MRPRTRTILGGLIAAALAALSPATAHAAFGVTEPNFEAGTCETKTCTYASITGNLKEAFTQAAGHPEWGITSFELNHDGEGIPDGRLKRIRVDVPEGLAANPQALPTCSKAQFEANAALCPATSKVGETELDAVAEPLGLLPIPLEKQKGTVYNLPLEPGLPLLFGIAVEPAGNLVAPVHLLLEGHVSFAAEPLLTARGVPSADYHEWFEVDNVPDEAEVKKLVGPPITAPLKTRKSKLLFEGRKGGNFLTLPSACSSTTTSYLEVESHEKEVSRTPTKTPVGVDGCDNVPFAPQAEIKGETTQSDAPDGASTEVRVAQRSGPTEVNTADIEDAHVTLPEGMTLNPSAARGLAACTAAQIGIGTANPVSCPEASKVGSTVIETNLPPGSLAGNVYLASPDGTAITGPPFTIYIDAETVYGVSVRLQGQVSPNLATGRLEATFLHNPQLPFSSLVLSAKPGPRAPLANPLACGAAATDFVFTPWTGLAPFSGSTPFATSPDGKGGACPPAPPFALAQATATSSPNAGAYTTFTLGLARGDGNQYLQSLATTLPAGVVGEVPAVPRCGEPAAASGSCPAASRIGTATATVGAGSEPFEFSGPVYLTGPYNGAPFGLSIPIEAAAGPFDLGRVVTRAQIGVDTYSGRVVAVSSVPTIVKGVPLRLRNLSVAVDHASFMLNPTSCGALSTDTRLTSTLGAQQILSTPFSVGNCSALRFKPTFAASTSARTSRAKGASLRVTMSQGAHQANLRSAVVQLPLQLPARLTTLQKACREATYAADPRSCPPGSVVGTATVKTPVLPDPLSGPATLVSHGGAAFPDLDILLQGNGGVSVILVGNTNIKGGITTSSFATVPDVPVSSFALDLPTGPHSALAAFGNLCKGRLTMPTTLTAQNGATIKQSTRITVRDCGVRILRRRVSRHRLILRIQAFAAGRITVRNRYLRTRTLRLRRPGTVTLRVALKRNAASRLRSGHRLKLKAVVSFAPSAKGEARSKATTTARFSR